MRAHTHTRALFTQTHPHALNFLNHLCSKPARQGLDLILGKVGESKIEHLGCEGEEPRAERTAGALIIRIGLWAPLYYGYIKEP